MKSALIEAAPLRFSSAALVWLASETAALQRPSTAFGAEAVTTLVARNLSIALSACDAPDAIRATAAKPVRNFIICIPQEKFGGEFARCGLSRQRPALPAPSLRSGPRRAGAGCRAKRRRPARSSRRSAHRSD